MCRLLAYLGPPLALGRLVDEPEHSLVVQSYAPAHMTSGVVNADGFGFAWYDQARQAEPFVYRNILPIWSDTNLPSLYGYVRSGCVLANVRSATPGQSLDISNTQPFFAEGITLLHNGFVEDFRTTLARVLRDALDDEAHQLIRGTTDTEHLFGWLVHHVRGAPTLAEGLAAGLRALVALAPEVKMTLNFILSDGREIVASRFAHGGAAPSLFHLSEHERYPGAALIASEPLFEDDAWHVCPEGSIVSIDPDHTVRVAHDLA
ncbi:MAG: ergothioneine biosynthesis protein EgtC [Alphaproteobacteria bacterium]|nr:ergothioneine biosynthesis protein EgtC [Alphaproteobacteria bacterium]